MSIFPNATCECARSSSSSCLCAALHGPHHGAQNSTTTGASERRTSRSKLSSVTSNTPAPYRSEPPAERRPPERPDLPHSLEHDPAAHLRGPLLAVGERDRDLDDAKPGAERPV